MPKTLPEQTAEPIEQSLQLAPAQAPPGPKPAARKAAEPGGIYAHFRNAMAASDGQEPPPEQFSALLQRAEVAHPTNDVQRMRVLGDLQQRFGNRYVQRVVAATAPAQTEAPHPPVQRQPASTPAADAAAPAPPLALNQGGGEPLDEGTRSFMASRFGRDFTDVRIHNDDGAQETAQRLNAEAFTTGRDIYFGRGAYQPTQESGRGLLAHELTHVVQQDRGSVRARRGISSRGDPLEREAESVRHAIIRGELLPPIGPASPPAIQRADGEGAPAPAPTPEAPPAPTAAPAPTTEPASEQPSGGRGGGAAPAGGGRRGGGTVPAPAARPGDFVVSFAGASFPIPLGELARRVTGGTLSVPPEYLRKADFPGFKVTQASLNLDEASQPTSGTLGASLTIPQLQGQGTLTIDKRGDATGDVSVTFSSSRIPGLGDTTINAKVGRDQLMIETDVPFNLPKVSGALHYKYDNRKHSGKGKAEYRGAKLQGSIEIIMSEAGLISGSGTLEMELFKGLKPKVDVAVDERRNVKVAGEVRVPGQIELFLEKKYEKSFFNFEKKFPLWGFTIPVIDVNVGLFAEIHAGAGFRAKFGPGVLRDIALTGQFGTDPETATEFGVGGEFFLPAGAEVVVNVGGGIGLGLAIADITGGIEAVGVAGLYTALTVRPNFKYSGGKYTISGMAELAGVAQVKFGINAFAKVDVGVWMFKGTVWRKDWKLAEWIWNTGLNVALRANMSYTLGEDFVPDFSFETGKVDPEAFIKDVMPESGSPVPAPPKPPVPEKATFTAEGTAGAQQPEAAAGAAPAPATPGAPAAQTQAGSQTDVPGAVRPEATFEAANESHRLWVKMEGGRPQLLIASDEQDFSAFIAELSRRIDRLRGLDDGEKQALCDQLNELRTIESQIESASGIEYNEEKARQTNAKLQTLIVRIRALLPTLKPDVGGVGSGRNIAIARVDLIDKATGVRASGTFMGTSREGTPPGTVPVPTSRAFTASEAGGFPRDFDAELKIMEYVAQKFGTRKGEVNQNVEGVVNVHSDFTVCPSCNEIFSQFKLMFPKANVFAAPLPTGR